MGSPRGGRKETWSPYGSFLPPLGFSRVLSPWYNALAMPVPDNALDYAPRSRVRGRWVRRVTWLIVILALSPVILVAMDWGATAYAGRMYSGTRPGMTRAQIDRRLWAFTNRTSKYPAISVAPPGKSVVVYELPWFGNSTAIRITYDANGVAEELLPIFIVS